MWRNDANEIHVFPARSTSGCHLRERKREGERLQRKRRTDSAPQLFKIAGTARVDTVPLCPLHAPRAGSGSFTVVGENLTSVI
jgi:hypothetical protein